MHDCQWLGFEEGSCNNQRAFFLTDENSNVYLLKVNIYSLTLQTDISQICLTNNSPQTVGRSLTAYFRLDGCARVICAVAHGTPDTECMFIVICV